MLIHPHLKNSHCYINEIFYFTGSAQRLICTISYRFGGRGGSGMAQYARSEAELEQIMDGLHEQAVCRHTISEGLEGVGWGDGIWGMW